MDTHDLTLVTIVAERVLEDRLTKEILDMGATGYTVTHTRGKGSRGMRTGDIPGQGVRIETLVSDALAERLLEHASRAWFPHYAVVVWEAPVRVARGDKYVSS